MDPSLIWVAQESAGKSKLNIQYFIFYLQISRSVGRAEKKSEVYISLQLTPGMYKKGKISIICKNILVKFM